MVYPGKVVRGDKVAVLSPSAGLPGMFPLPFDLGCTRLRKDFGLVPVDFGRTDPQLVISYGGAGPDRRPGEADYGDILMLLEDDGVYQAQEYGQLDLTGQSAGFVEVERCRFKGTVLSGVRLERGHFADVTFHGADLANTRFRDMGVSDTTIAQSRLTGAAWVDCTFRDVLIEGCRTDLASFRFSRFKNVVFRDCNLVEANFQGADLTGARFEDCKLERVQFSGAKLAGTRFTACDLYGISGVDSLRGAIVSSADVQSLAYALAASLGIRIED